MIIFYFVRHCESDGNALRRFQGVSDCDINENGLKQLACLKDRFKDVALDEIFTSPLKRAKKTALAIKGDKDIKITEMPLLIEMDGGDIEGMSFVDIYKVHREIETAWFDTPHKYYSPGGESMTDVYLRAEKAIDILCKENDGKIIAVTSHGIFLRNLMCCILHKDIHSLNSVDWFDNTAVTKCVYNNGDFKFEYYNDVSHLTDGLLPMSSKILDDRKLK